jgi:hypothetical protein
MDLPMALDLGSGKMNVGGELPTEGNANFKMEMKAGTAPNLRVSVSLVVSVPDWI